MTEAEAFGSIETFRLPTARPSKLERHGQVRHGRGAPIGESGDDAHPLLSRKGRPLEHHRGDRQIRRSGDADRDGRNRRAFGQTDFLAALPSGLLKVADEHHFPARECGAKQQALGQTQRRRETRRVGRYLGVVDRGFELAAITGRADRFLGARRKQHERALIGAAETVDHLQGLGLGALPDVPVTHAGGPVEEDDHLPRARHGTGRRDGVDRQKRSREGSNQQHHRAGPHEEQPPVVDPAPFDGLVRHALDEHERRKLDDVLPLALDEVHQDRHGDGREPQEEERCKKRHGYRTRIRRSRLPRYRNSASSSGFDVSSCM